MIFQDYRHVGRVTEIKDGRVYTNEGNTSALYGDSNGGTVREKNYILTDPNILGYCIINYGEDNGETDTEKGFLPEGTIQAKSQTESYQRWLNTWYSSLLTTYMGEPLEEDGSFGPKTRQGSLLVWKDILNRLYGKRLSCFLASNFPHFHRYDSLKSALYIHAVSKNINTFPKNQGRIRAAIAVKILDFTVMYR